MPDSAVCEVPSSAVAAPRSSSRITSLDFVRGVAMVLMAIDHVRVYSKSGFIQRVIEAGFRIVEYGKEFFGDESFVRHGISSQSILYVVEK